MCFTYISCLSIDIRQACQTNKIPICLRDNMLLTQNTHADVVKCRFLQAIFSPRWLNSSLPRQNNNITDPPPRKSGCLVILPLFIVRLPQRKA